MKAAKKRRWNNESGFTLIEVGIAVMVLSLTVASSIVAMKIGFSMIESARDNTLASQILQSEMENLRLQSWDKIVILSDGDFDMDGGLSSIAADRFISRRNITQLKPGLHEITLQVEWKTSSGRTMSRQYVSFFSKSGLNDYYYRAF